MNDEGARQSPAATIKYPLPDGTTGVGAVSEARLAPRLLGVGEPVDDFRAWVARRAYEHQRNEAANAVRILRRRRPDGFDFDRIQADKVARALEVIEALLEPTAGDLVAVGWEVDEALEYADAHAAELHRRMGGKP